MHKGIRYLKLIAIGLILAPFVLLLKYTIVVDLPDAAYYILGARHVVLDSKSIEGLSGLVVGTQQNAIQLISLIEIITQHQNQIVWKSSYDITFGTLKAIWILSICAYIFLEIKDFLNKIVQELRTTKNQ